MPPLDIRALDCCPTPAVHATMPFVVAGQDGWMLVRCQCGKEWAYSWEGAANHPDQLVEWFTPLKAVESSGAAKLGPAMDYRSLRRHRQSLRVCGGAATWTTDVQNSRADPPSEPT